VGDLLADHLERTILRDEVLSSSWMVHKC
jgi:hypothetical protein